MTLREAKRAILTIDDSRYSGSGTIVRQAGGVARLTAPGAILSDRPIHSSTHQRYLIWALLLQIIVSNLSQNSPILLTFISRLLNNPCDIA